jgi:hypothetical protein
MNLGSAIGFALFVAVSVLGALALKRIVFTLMMIVAARRRKAQWSEKRNVPVLEAPKGRRDEFVEPYFKGAKPDEVVAVLKAREPARIMIAIGDKAANRWHLQFAERWVVQFNFYVNDE